MSVYKDTMLAMRRAKAYRMALVYRLELRGVQLQLSKQYPFYSRHRYYRDGGRDICHHERYRLSVILKVDRGIGREWYGTIECYRYESPYENEEKGVDDQNGGWDKIVQAYIASQGSIE